ncbi:hypothetical protein QBZ16_005310 [Prototheca wickerhamii]|uniref:Uncharacterized protein n=1 Tax=Prototheca wickerhamii TaxID=3111 RepID=A0AAD9IH58_PROWI|nr:hypothetical protein QBZ16_005310 [Prototheca wickerhamii]
MSLEMHNARRRKRPAKRHRGDRKGVEEEDGASGGSPVKRTGSGSGRRLAGGPEQVSGSATTSVASGTVDSTSDSVTLSQRMEEPRDKLGFDDSWDAPMHLDDGDLLLDTTLPGLSLPSIPSFATLSLGPPKHVPTGCEVPCLSAALGQELDGVFDDIFVGLDDDGAVGLPGASFVDDATGAVGDGVTGSSLGALGGLGALSVPVPSAAAAPGVPPPPGRDVLAGSGPRHGFFYPPQGDPVAFDVPQAWPAPSFPLPIDSEQLALPLHKLPPVSRLLRMSLKLYGVSPAALPADLQEQLVGMLQCGPEELECFIRPGCVHLVLDAPPSAPPAAAADLEEAAAEAVAAALRASAALRALPFVAAQFKGAVVLVRRGRIVGVLDVARGAGKGIIPVIQRAAPLAILSVHRGEEGEENVDDEDAPSRSSSEGLGGASLSGPGPAAPVLPASVLLQGFGLRGNTRTWLARQPEIGDGTFLSVEVLADEAAGATLATTTTTPCASRPTSPSTHPPPNPSSVCVRVPRAVPGQLVFECQRGIFLSAPRRVVVSDDAAVVREVRALGSARAAACAARLGIPSVEELLMGIGVAVGLRDNWLRHAHRGRAELWGGGRTRLPPSERELRSSASLHPDDAARLLSPAWWPLMGRCLLFAVLQDCPAVLAALLAALRLAALRRRVLEEKVSARDDDATVSSSSPAAVVVRLVDALIPKGRGVLSLAQRAGAARAEAALRDWALQRDVRWAEDGAPGGELPPVRADEGGAPENPAAEGADKLAAQFEGLRVRKKGAPVAEREAEAAAAAKPRARGRRAERAELRPGTLPRRRRLGGRGAAGRVREPRGAALLLPLGLDAPTVKGGSLSNLVRKGKTFAHTFPSGPFLLCPTPLSWAISL